MKIIIYLIIGIALYQICILIGNSKIAAYSKNWAHKKMKSECVSKIAKLVGCSVYDIVKMLIDIFRSI